MFFLSKYSRFLAILFFISSVSLATVEQFNTIIIPGFSGDLAKRKLIPALYQLVKEGMKGIIIAVGRKDSIDIDEILSFSKKFIANYDNKIAENLKAMLHYHKLNIDNLQEFKDLANFINKHELKNCDLKSDKLNCTRIIYLSVPADSFGAYTQSFVDSGIIKRNNANHRIAYEKPFGWDLKSAEEIYKTINKLIETNQQFFVDHYLAKGIVPSISSLIADNIIFSNIWNKSGIKRINIHFDENIDIEKRGSFYDRYGVFKDVIQNHVLQLLATICTAQEATKQAKTSFLKSLSISSITRGQYEGYLKEPDVDPNSTTQTFGALKLNSNQDDWKGVKFYVQAGKSLEKKSTRIEVLFKEENSTDCSGNLIIEVAPESKISMQLCIKDNLIKFDYAADRDFADAYILILKDLLDGTHKFDVSFAEIQAQWALIEKAQKLESPLIIYPKGASEVRAAPIEQLCHKHKLEL